MRERGTPPALSKQTPVPDSGQRTRTETWMESVNRELIDVMPQLRDSRAAVIQAQETPIRQSGMKLRYRHMYRYQLVGWLDTQIPILPRAKTPHRQSGMGLQYQ